MCIMCFLLLLSAASIYVVKSIVYQLFSLVDSNSMNNYECVCVCVCVFCVITSFLFVFSLPFVIILFRFRRMCSTCIGIIVVLDLHQCNAIQNPIELIICTKFHQLTVMQNNCSLLSFYLLLLETKQQQTFSKKKTEMIREKRYIERNNLNRNENLLLNSYVHCIIII